MGDLKVRKINSKDDEWIKKILINHWASVKVIMQGKIYYANKLPGFLALYRDQKAGLINYKIENKTIIIISLISIIKNVGIGSALLEQIFKYSLRKKISLIKTTTTNDKTDALRFFQLKGFILQKVNINIIEKYRRLKPEIPLNGFNNIEIRDEIILKRKI